MVGAFRTGRAYASVWSKPWTTVLPYAQISTASPSNFARSRTFFGYLASSTSLANPAIIPPAPSSWSAASRNCLLGARRPRSTDDTCSSLYPIAAPSSDCLSAARSRHILMTLPTVRRTAAESSSPSIACGSFPVTSMPRHFHAARAGPRRTATGQ